MLLSLARYLVLFWNKKIMHLFDQSFISYKFLKLKKNPYAALEGRKELWIFFRTEIRLLPVQPKFFLDISSHLGIKNFTPL